MDRQYRPNAQKARQNVHPTSGHLERGVESTNGKRDEDPQEGHRADGDGSEIPIWETPYAGMDRETGMRPGP